jgi:hypothetical protein
MEEFQDMETTTLLPFTVTKPVTNQEMSKEVQSRDTKQRNMRESIRRHGSISNQQ